MKIDVKINKVFNDSENKLKAIASVNLDECYAVHGIKIYESEKGDFVLMPSVKVKDEYKDTFHAVTKEARQELNDAVLNAYQQKIIQLQDEELEQKDEETQTMNM